MKKNKSTIEVTQLSVGGLDHNFTYLIHDTVSGDATIIDPCGDESIIENAVRSAGKINPLYILLTHGHHDHRSGVAKVKTFFNAPLGAHPECTFPHELSLSDGQKLPLGDLYIECIHAPGHSDDGMLYRLSDDSALFTGDTLFIDYCGYCNPVKMFKTMREIIYPLADSNIVYSGHDYGHAPFASLGEEKRTNPYLYSDNFEIFRKELRNL